MVREGLRLQRRRLARALRDLCAELVACDVPDEIFRSAAEATEDLVVRLRERPRRSRNVGGSVQEEIRNEGDRYHYGELVDFSPLAGLSNPIAPPMRIRKEDEATLGATVCFSAVYEGGPGVVHGGYVAAAFDELLGLAQSLTGHAGLTASLKVRYRAPCPIEKELRMVGHVAEVCGRRIVAKGEMYLRRRRITEAEAMFVVLERERYLEKISSDTG